MTPEAEQEMQATDSVMYDLTSFTPVNHRFDRIIGNQLLCTLHADASCPRLTIKPTEVLEVNDKGELILIDKASSVIA